MLDDSESTLGMPFLTASLILVSLFIAWYRRVDPLVSLHLSFLHMPRAAANVRLISIARCHSSSRIQRSYSLVLIRLQF
jgi:hypothetical protein